MERISNRLDYTIEMREAALASFFMEKYMAVGDVNSNERGSGARFNDGKVRYDLIPTHLLESTANVLEYGANKYAPWNWAKGMPFSVVIGCLKRHLAAIERGEDLDAETGQRHTGHLICNLLFLEHYMNEYPEMDDRPKEWFAEKAAPIKERDDNNKAKTLQDSLAIFQKEFDAKRTIKDEQRAISTTTYQPSPYTLVDGRLSNVRSYVQPADASSLTFIYADDYGVEYWKDSNGRVARYDSAGFKLD